MPARRARRIARAAALRAGTALRAAAFSILLAALPDAAPRAAAGSATQGAFPDLPWSAAGAILGSGSVAVASDPSALYWNPAGLMDAQARSIMGGSGDLFGMGLVRHSYAAIALPHRPMEIQADARGDLVLRRAQEASRVLAAGADVLSLDARGDAYRETRISLAYAFRSMGASSAGLRISYLSVGGDIDGLGASGYDIDLGLRVPFGGTVAGVVLRHALSSLSWDAGDAERLNLRLQGGLSIRLLPLVRIPLGASWDPEGVGLQEWSAGLEIRPPAGPVTLLGGWRLRPADVQENLFSGGVTLSHGRLSAAYGFTADEAGVDATHRFDLGILF